MTTTHRILKRIRAHATGYEDPAIRAALETLHSDIQKAEAVHQKKHKPSEKALENLASGYHYKTLGDWALVPLDVFKRERVAIRKLIDND